MVSGIACHLMRPESQPEPIYPQFTPPAGFTPKANPGSKIRLFGDARDQFYAVAPGGYPGRDVAGELENPEFRERILGALGARGEADPIVVAGHKIWRGTLSTKKLARLAMTVLRCGELSFIVHFIGDPVSLDEATQVLGRVSCPSIRRAARR